MKPVPEETNKKGTVSRNEINIFCFRNMLYFLCLHKPRQCAKHTHTMTPCPQPILTDAFTVRCSNQTHIHPLIHTPTIHRVVQPPPQKSSTDSVRCLPAHDILWSHWLAGTQHSAGWQPRCSYQLHGLGPGICHRQQVKQQLEKGLLRLPGKSPSQLYLHYVTQLQANDTPVMMKFHKQAWALFKRTNS